MIQKYILKRVFEDFIYWEFFYEDLGYWGFFIYSEFFITLSIWVRCRLGLLAFL